MDKAARWSIIGVMVVLIIGLSFGMGFALRMVFEDDAPKTARVAAPVQAADGEPDFSVLTEMYRALKDNYIEPESLDPELLRTGAINGLINTIGDPYQVYISKDAKLGFNDDISGQFEGIGASVDSKNGEITIVQPYEGSPAQKAGIRPGDVILEVNGESTKGWTTQQAVSKIRGKRGTEVRLKVRHVDNKVEDLTPVRDQILLPSVKVDIPTDAQGKEATDIGYIRIQQFTGRTPEELRKALNEARTKNYKGMIIDLRNNPGGLLSAVKDVTGEFMPGQTVLIEQRRGGGEEVHKTKSSGIAANIPIVVLVNHNSASASELMAGALRDNKRAMVMGETTLGKGTVNRGIELERDGGLLYITVGRWMTPGREQIEGKGIKPTIEVKAADNEDPLGYFNQPMFKAVEYLRNGG